jgi:hypothetical protein
MWLDASGAVGSNCVMKSFEIYILFVKVIGGESGSLVVKAVRRVRDPMR